MEAMKRPGHALNPDNSPYERSGSKKHTLAHFSTIWRPANALIHECSVHGGGKVKYTQEVAGGTIQRPVHALF